MTKQKKIVLIMILAVVAFLIYQYVSSVRWAEEITRRAESLGMTTEEYQELVLFERQHGLDVDKTYAAMMRTDNSSDGADDRLPAFRFSSSDTALIDIGDAVDLTVYTPSPDDAGNLSLDITDESVISVETFVNDNTVKLHITALSPGYSNISASLPDGSTIPDTVQIVVEDPSAIVSTDVVNQYTTFGMENALEEAKSYLQYSSFSYQGLIDQLEYEKYTHDEAVYAVDHCGADWYEQAVATAESYLEYMAFSRDRLIDQLEYSGFTHEQAVYAVGKVGY